MHSSYCFDFEKLQQQVEACRLCPRLVKHRETVPSSKAFAEEPHWRRPVMGYGDSEAKLLILGLAPSSQGANRTGRLFTGDQTARFLIRVLFLAGFANQSTSLFKGDGLKFKGCYLTASVKCVPPHHQPLSSEFQRCRPYFENELFLLKKVKAVLALGKGAFDTYVDFLKKQVSFEGAKPRFAHGAKLVCTGWPTLYASYHPTPQNTNTGKLTEEMLLKVLHSINKDFP